jgi:hypothetical protein
VRVDGDHFANRLPLLLDRSDGVRPEIAFGPTGESGERGTMAREGHAAGEPSLDSLGVNLEP